jgi:hypothetical protein
MAHCKQCLTRNAAALGTIYVESKAGLTVDYFICKQCLDVKEHVHRLDMRAGWTHLYGDISGNDIDWMAGVRAQTRDTLCGVAGYATLNPQSTRSNALI